MRGVAASPGAAKGEVVFSADEAVAAAEEGRDVILVRPFTEAEDVAGFHAAKGILTSMGGKASHAALVARGMGKPCVAGAGDLKVDLKAKRMRVGETELGEGDTIVIDGSTGAVTADDVPLEEPKMSEAFETVLGWADEVRTLGVRANADTAADATRAREFGAAGIGLCRSEHIFLGTENQQRMQEMIMAETDEERAEALDVLLALQQEHFTGLFDAMEGLPVTIRLLDPPLHEFIPNAEELAQEVERARIEESDELEELEHTLERVHALAETNPDARHARCPAGRPPPGGLRDADAGDRALGSRGARAQRRVSAARGDGAARDLRAGARADARAARAGGGGGGRHRPRRLRSAP